MVEETVEVTKRASVFEEVRRLASDGEADSLSDATAAISRISPKELEEVRRLRAPPTVVRRTLEATYLLLNAKANSPTAPPSWAKVREMLSSDKFLPRMQAYEASALRKTPALTAYIAAEYFSGTAKVPEGASQRGRGGLLDRHRSTIAAGVSIAANGTANGVAGRSSLRQKSGPLSSPRSQTTVFASTAARAERKTWTSAMFSSLTKVDEPLTYQRVSRASQAVGALFRWCTIIMAEALGPSSDEQKEGEQAGEDNICLSSPFSSPRSGSPRSSAAAEALGSPASRGEPRQQRQPQMRPLHLAQSSQMPQQLSQSCPGHDPQQPVPASGQPLRREQQQHREEDQPLMRRPSLTQLPPLTRSQSPPSAAARQQQTQQHHTFQSRPFPAASGSTAAPASSLAAAGTAVLTSSPRPKGASRPSSAARLAPLSALSTPQSPGEAGLHPESPPQLTPHKRSAKHALTLPSGSIPLWRTTLASATSDTWAEAESLQPLPKPDRQPDRHFEEHVAFKHGSGRLLDEGEASLQTVAATLCMRDKLYLELVSSPAWIENYATAEARLVTVEQFLTDEGLSCAVSREKRTSGDDQEPGVTCVLRLDNDPQLRDLFLGLKEVCISDKTRSIASWLEENFRICMH